ncbi:DUF721 domain-containing protein [bacterium]|nr:DUF721 domain-containing protein [bacterium]
MPVTLREVLVDIVKRSNNAREEITKIRNIWPTVIIKDGRGHLNPYKYEDNILFVMADGPDWATYMRMETMNIKETLEHELNLKIEKVVVRVKFFKKFTIKKNKKANSLKQLKNKDIDKIRKSAKKKELFGYLLYEFYKNNKGEK